MNPLQIECPHCGKEFISCERSRLYCSVGCECAAGYEYRAGKMLIDIKYKLLNIFKDFGPGITVMDPAYAEESECFILSFRGPEHRTLELRTGAAPTYFVTWYKDEHLSCQEGTLGLNLDDIEKTFNWLLTGEAVLSKPR